jgi:hypothetical protein
MTDIQWPTPASLEETFTLTPRNEARAMVYIECESQNGQNAAGTYVKRGPGFYLLYASDIPKVRKRLARDGSDDGDEAAARKVYDRKLAEHVKKTVPSDAHGAERDRLMTIALATIGTSVEAERYEMLADKGRKPFAKFIVAPEDVAAPRTPESAAVQAHEGLVAAITKAILLASSGGAGAAKQQSGSR